MQKFPKDFYWGASTASHQVEGGNHNQWTVWELGHAAELAKSASDRLSYLPNWPDIRKQASDPANYVSGEGVDHYRRYKEDFDLLEDLNMNAFRFSIEWSRIEPEEGQWNEAAIEYYRRYIHELRRRGIEPFMNIWHWTNPVWFEDKGAFAKRQNIKYFERFVAKVTESLLDEMKFVLVLNEVTSYLTNGYISATWPPQEKNLLKGVYVYCNLITAHKRAYKLIKKSNPKMQVGAAHPLTAFVPSRAGNLWDRLVIWLTWTFWDGWFFVRTRNQQDFIGFNFYFTAYLHGTKAVNPKEPNSDLGWYMEPSRVYDVLMHLHKQFNKPIYVTESGVADAKDQYRQWWLEETIKGMQRAISKGVNLRGYFHWSLLDNFEWSAGWWPKFGLVHVDREHGMKRTVRPSAKWFGRFIATVRK